MKDTIISLGGTNIEGLFRIPGKQDDVDGYKQLFNEGKYSIYKECNCNTIAGLFKLFLRELPSPVIPASYYDKFVNEDVIFGLEGKPEKVMELIGTLPKINRDMFIFIIDFLQYLSQFEENTKMDKDNLAMVFSACMLISPELDPFSALTKTNLAKTLIYVVIEALPKTAIEQLNLSIKGYTPGSGMPLLETDPILSLKEERETEQKKTKEKNKKSSNVFRNFVQSTSKSEKRHSKHGSDIPTELTKSVSSVPGEKINSPKSPTSPTHKRGISADSSRAENPSSGDVSSSSPKINSPVSANYSHSPKRSGNLISNSELYDLHKAPPALTKPSFVVIKTN